ncbi:hypothetical protein Hypma_004609 [Hypsizygus marmoreus]|uniref:BTB domain-containing protein n=1 Tax=Hypsizygus marmoreus TaxID=39966 RepID=A0A369K891_HYPMA|nr:hypothetical protein Hypma_004609 [Hypsizygus marmoreus]
MAVNSEDADVAFKSSDGVLFRIHSFNLKACTEGFAPPEHSTFKEIVPLTEVSSTLELLFQFIYPIPQPDLALLEFPVLNSLSEAVEKYQVFPAMNICKAYMRKQLPDQAESVFKYSLKHGYRGIMVQVLPLILAKPLEESAGMMPSNVVLQWIKYYGAWARVASTAIHGNPGLGAYCLSCHSTLNDSVHHVMTQLGIGGISALQDLDSVFPPACCVDGGSQIRVWRKSVEDNIKSIPDFEGLAGTERPWGIEFYEPWDKSDVIIKSNDGKLFHVHRANLEKFTSGLISSTVNEVTSSTESASTLDHLFQFVYPVRQPDLESLDFDTLASLALAVEKFKVHSAMAICRVHMAYALPKHPSVVMSYAASNKFYDLMNVAAPLIVVIRIDESLALMTPDLAVAWIRYYERWNEVSRSAFSFSSNMRVSTRPHPRRWVRSCDGCKESSEDTLDEATIGILCKLGQGVKVLGNLDHVFDLASACCETRKEDLRAWRCSIEEGIRAIPAFETFVET